MSKNKKEVAQVATVSSEVSSEVSNNESSIMLEGLESNEVVEESNTPQYDNVEWLTKTVPFFPEEFTSKKCNLEREPNVLAGMNKIAEIDPTFPVLLRLLGAWWENKAARSEIKKMIDAEAVAMNIDPIIYMQHNLKQYAEKYNGLADAAKRLCYATTYFKPRGGVKEVIITKRVLIENEVYVVPVEWLKEIKTMHGEDRDAIIAEVKATCPKEMTDEL